jgi:hypothetical protein
METLIEQPALNIDKSDWKLVKFGDTVAEPKETCKDIIAEGIEHVVGLSTSKRKICIYENMQPQAEEYYFFKEVQKRRCAFWTKESIFEKSCTSRVRWNLFR